MAGSSTIAHQSHRTIRSVTWAWTSDAAGDMDDGLTSFKVTGEVVRVVSNPDDVAAPTALWDFVVNDADGVDILGGGGANRDAAASEQVVPDPPIPVDSTLSLVVSNAGNAKQGTVTLYYRM